MEETEIQKRGTFGLPGRREEVAGILKECYSRDFFELEEFEARIEKVEDAGSLEELEALVADIPEPFKQLNASPVSPAFPEANAPLTLVHGKKKIRGSRLLARNLRLELKQSVLKLDYRDMEQLPTELSLHFDTVGSVCKLIVPAGVVVEEALNNTGSVIKHRIPRRYRDVPAQTVLRLTGRLERSVLKVVTRRPRRKKRGRKSRRR